MGQIVHARTGSVILAASLLAACSDTSLPPRPIVGGDPDRGRRVAERSACGACHEIPGVAWPRGHVGGSLDGFARRALIAGRLPNQPQVLIRWLRDPAALLPDTGMPRTALSAAETRDVAAFLYTLE